MVAGRGSGSTYLSSTEIYVKGSASWQTINAQLPGSHFALKAVNYQNTILTFGNRHVDYKYEVSPMDVL